MDDKKDDCTCRQCLDITFAINLIKNHKPMDGKIFFSLHPNLEDRHPIARMILDNGIVLCKDGMVRIK
ncbi:hypothetical protein HN682_03580 [Candidatus Peregrinibacteria bacterium]|nr:hypothetical protein [Candidatus Peregrinibacteria bacterium]